MILELVLVKGFQLILAVPNVSFRESLKLSVRVSPEVRVVPVIELPVLNGWRIVCLNPLDQTLSSVLVLGCDGSSVSLLGTTPVT